MPSPNVNHILVLGNSGFYSVGGTQSLGLRFSFYSGLFVRSGGYEAGSSCYRSGRGGEVSVGNNIVNTV